jgi:hypothetical protein
MALGIEGLYLPPRIIGYIGSFIRAHYDADMLLNLYKAFAFEDMNDPLAYYKEDVQCYLSALATGGVFDNREGYINSERVFDPEDKVTLNHQEVMYAFECMYGDYDAFIYQNAYSVQEDMLDPIKCNQIDDEFYDCSALAKYSSDTFFGIRFGMSDYADRLLYKSTILLEFILRTKSQNLLDYMKKKLIITPEMVLYLYVKHNHPLYAPKTFSLAADETLLGEVRFHCI